MAIPNEIARHAEKINRYKRIQNDEDFMRSMGVIDGSLKQSIRVCQAALEKSIKHAEVYYSASRDQVANREIAKLKLSGTSILKWPKGYTHGCILPDLHKETMVLKKLEARLKGENKKRVSAIVKYNLETLKNCGFLKRSFPGRIQRAIKKRFFSFI